MNNSKRDQLYLSALLHDIGKFYQRAKASSQAPLPNEQDKAQYLPQRNGNYMHAHALWTAQFIDDHAETFSELVSNIKDFKKITSGHHLQNEDLDSMGPILKEANNYSSGMDRESDVAIKDDEDERQYFGRKPMMSILESICNPKDGSYQIPCETISLNRDKSFPRKSLSNELNYSELWESFVVNFIKLPRASFYVFTENLISLLSTYCSQIPTSTINFKDVSLFDHLKTTAALSLCLYDHNNGDKTSQEPFLLIGADLSGIQSYIYQITAKKAAKNLKGRSFYLRLLSDSILKFIIKELNLNSSCIIYNSGGGFYLLAPNTASTLSKLEECIKKIEEELFRELGTTVFAAISYVELSRDMLMRKNGLTIRDAWNLLFEKKDRKKSSKFSSIVDLNYEQFFEGNDQFSQNNESQVELGTILKDTEVMVISDQTQPQLMNIHSYCPLHLGFYYYFLPKGQKYRVNVLQNCRVVTFNQKQELINTENIFCTEYYGGNRSNFETYESMCEQYGQEDSFERLGVLRMDVDNLGSIFREGIPSEKATLSRYSALSRSFDYFFSGYLNKIQEAYFEKTAIVYSGGDDLFIVGDWRSILKLAEKIRYEFREFTCNNPKFSISGGVAIVSSKFPVMRAAFDSAELESTAKAHTCDGFNKNAICFLGYALNWDKEYPIVKKLTEQLIEFLSTNKIPKSILGKIISHAQTANFTKENKVKNYKVYWMLAYDLGRAKERYREDSQVKSLLNRCISEVIGKSTNTLNGISISSTYHPLQLWSFACRWAELEHRSN